MGVPSILKKIVEVKKIEVADRKEERPLSEFRRQLKWSDRDFKGAIVGGGDTVALIAEVKQASPSEGMIVDNKGNGGSFDPVEVAKVYEKAGASAISVLTDEQFFKGSLDYLKQVSEGTDRVPLLCKDFIIDEYQIYEARDFGADAILLIAGILSEEEMEKFLGVARELKMDAICEVHDEAELDKVLTTSAEIIGINNRDLNTFDVDLSSTEKLVERFLEMNGDDTKVLVSESGIYSGEDVRLLPERVDAILVGTSLMKAENVEGRIRELVNARKVE